MNIPRVNWPGHSGKYKVVQVDIDGLPYLRFSEADHAYHASILHQLLSDFCIEYGKVKEEGSDEEIPAPSGDRYALRGAGRASVSLQDKRATFYGASTAYRIDIDSKHLETVRELEPDWKMNVA